jgi:hypothetical protein
MAVLLTIPVILLISVCRWNERRGTLLPGCAGELDRQGGQWRKVCFRIAGETRDFSSQLDWLLRAGFRQASNGANVGFAFRIGELRRQREERDHCGQNAYGCSANHLVSIARPGLDENGFSRLSRFNR